MDAFAKLIAEDVLIFAYCSEDNMDEDFAVTQLERIAEQLRSMDEEVRSRFINAVREMERESRAAGLEERADQLASMPEHLGLEG